jgi:hypothetical protein
MIGSFSTAILTGTTAGVIALLTFGINRAARRAGQPKSIASSVAVEMLVWVGVNAGLAQSGVLADWTAFPPRWPLLPLTALVTLVLLSLTPTFRGIG